MAATVNNRIATVKKKAGELATLSGAEIGLVCFMPDGSFFTWPPEHNKVRSTLLRYNQLLLHHQLPNPNLDSKKRKRIDPPNPNLNPKKRKPDSQTLDHHPSLLDSNIQESIHLINLVESGQNQLEFDALVQEWESGVPSAEIQELDIHSELGHSQLEKEASSPCAELGLTVAQSSDAHLHELDPWIQVDNQLEGAGLDDFVEELEACLPCDDDDLHGLDKNEPQSQVDNQLEEAGFDDEYVEELEACIPCDDDLQGLEENELWVQVGDGQADSGVLGLTNEELQLWIHPDSTYVQELEAWQMEREETRGNLEH